MIFIVQSENIAELLRTISDCYRRVTDTPALEPDNWQEVLQFYRLDSCGVWEAETCFTEIGCDSAKQSPSTSEVCQWNIPLSPVSASVFKCHWPSVVPTYIINISSSACLPHSSTLNLAFFCFCLIVLNFVPFMWLRVIMTRSWYHSNYQDRHVQFTFSKLVFSANTQVHSERDTEVTWYKQSNHSCCHLQRSTMTITLLHFWRSVSPRRWFDTEAEIGL